MKIHDRTLQKGRSMVEMMGYMAVVLTVVAAIGNLVSHAYDEFKYSKASMQVSDLAAAIVRSSAVDTDYSSVTGMVGSVNDKGKQIIPKSFRVVGNKIYHAFGGEVNVGVMSGDATKFFIRFTKLKRKQCIELAMKEWQNNQSVDLYQIAVNSHYWYWSVYSDVSSSDGTLPIKRSAVAGTGSGNGQCSDNNNTIMWVFN